MSNVVGGGISRGEGNEQVMLSFVGFLGEAEWRAFVRCVVECAERFGVEVGEVDVTRSEEFVRRSNGLELRVRRLTKRGRVNLLTSARPKAATKKRGTPAKTRSARTKRGTK